MRSEGKEDQLPEPRVNNRKVAGNLEHFRKLFPQLDGLQLQQSWAGRIDLTPDIIPIIDKLEETAGLFVTAGFSGHGFALAPAVGEQMACWIANGTPDVDLSAFRVRRFTQGQISRAKHAL